MARSSLLTDCHLLLFQFSSVNSAELRVWLEAHGVKVQSTDPKAAFAVAAANCSLYYF